MSFVIAAPEMMTAAASDLAGLESALSAAVAPITAVAGTLSGHWFAGRNEEKRDERTATREATARHAALAERLADQRHVIQRETLMALQTELVQLTRITAQVVIYDRDAVRQVLAGWSESLTNSVPGL